MALALLSRKCPLCGGSRTRPLLTVRDLNERITDERFSIVRCECSMAFLDPAPADPAAVYPATYDPHAAPSGTARNSRRLAYLDGVAPARLLDIGCGSGRDLGSMQSRGWKVVGVEINDAAAARGRERGIDIRTGMIETVGLPPESTDVVTMFHVLEHVVDPVRTLRETVRVLRPGGVLLAHVPNLGGLNAHLFGEFWYQLDVPRHVNFFDAKMLDRTLRQAGLAPVFLRTRTTPTSFRRSMKLALRRYPFAPFEGAIQVTARVMNLFRWGDVIEVVARKPIG